MRIDRVVTASTQLCLSAILRILLTISLVLPVASFAQTWNLAWSEEFTGTTLDSTKWAFDYGNLKVNNELEYYCGPVGDSRNQYPCTQVPNVYLDGSGHLVIQAVRVGSSTDPYSNSWSSARLKTQGLVSFQYGRIESSMKLPTGAGLWPAFWALGDNVETAGWPQCGEEDYMENVPAVGGLGPAVISSTLHGPTYYASNGLSGRYTLPNGGHVDTSFHAYGAIWSPSMVQFYVDSPTNVFFVRTASDVPGGTSQWAFNHSFFLLLNLAVGGTGSWPGPPDNTTPNPATMLVDYVRQYTASPALPPDLGNPSPITVRAGSTTGNTTTLDLTSMTKVGRVYLSCTTDAPNASCAATSSDALDAFTVDFSQDLAATATVTVTTSANTEQAGFFGGRSALGLAAIMVVVGLFGMVDKQRPFRLIGLAGVALVLLLVPSCGGSGSSGGGSAGGGTTPGTYTVTVSAYTVSNAGGLPDATVKIPLTVNY